MTNSNNLDYLSRTGSSLTGVCINIMDLDCFAQILNFRRK